MLHRKCDLRFMSASPAANPSTLSPQGRRLEGLQPTPSPSIAIDLRLEIPRVSPAQGPPTPQQQAPGLLLVHVRETKPASNYHPAASVGDR